MLTFSQTLKTWQFGGYFLKFSWLMNLNVLWLCSIFRTWDYADQCGCYSSHQPKISILHGTCVDHQSGLYATSVCSSVAHRDPAKNRTITWYDWSVVPRKVQIQLYPQLFSLNRRERWLNIENVNLKNGTNTLHALSCYSTASYTQI